MDLNDKTDDEILLIANPVMDNLMDGATERDWAKHTLHFTDGAKASLTEAELLRQCEQYQSTHGVFKERVFMGITRHPDYTNIIWKQTMTKASGEYMAFLTLVQKESEYLVIRCWVDLWDLKK